MLEQKIEEMPTKKQLKEELMALEKASDKKIADAFTLKTKSAEAIAKCDKTIEEDLLQSKKFTADEKAFFKDSEIFVSPM